VLLVPINLEVLGGKAGPWAGLPVIVKARGPQQIHALVGRPLAQECGVQEAGIHAMRTRQ
jgi:hypothetical protein